MANYVKFKQGLKKDFNTTNQPLTNGMIYFVIDENNNGSIYYDTIVDGKQATKKGTVHRVKFSGLPIKITGSVTGTGVISKDGETIEINTSTNHSHGLAHQDFTVALSNDDTNLKWTRLGNQNGGGFWLKSIRGQSKAPAWFLPDYSAGIAFGGEDTKGIISVKYSQPGVRFAGGNGSAPVWYFTITGANDKTYDLSKIGGHSSDSAKLDHNVTFKIASTADATNGANGTKTDLSGAAVNLYLPTKISGFDLLQASRFQGNADSATYATSAGYAKGLFLNPETRQEDMNFNLADAKYIKRVTYSMATSTTKKNKPPVGDANILSFGWDNSGYGSQLAIQNGNAGHLAVRGSSSNNGASSWGNWSTVLDSSNYTSYVNNYYWANIKVSTASSTETKPTFNTAYTSNWWRSTGKTGWWNDTYSGGIAMEDKTYVKVAGNKSFLIPNGSLKIGGDGNIFFATGGDDATLKIYGQINTKFGIETIAIQTCFDNQDPQTSGYTTQYANRCNLLLQPRGGQVYIGKNLTTLGNVGYKLLVGGNQWIEGNLIIRSKYAVNFFGSGDQTYTQSAFIVNNTDGFILEAPRSTNEMTATNILPFRIRTRGGQPAPEYAGDRLVENDCMYNIGSTTAEFGKGYIRAIAARHLDADAVFNGDHTLYIGYGNVAYTDKTAFFYSNLSSKTQFAEINSNGLYALTRFGVNGQNTGYTCYINGTLFSGTHTVYGRSDSNTAPSNFYYNGALEIRESNLVTSSQSSFNYAPRIGFHWGGRIAASLSFNSDGIFYFRKQDGSSRATIDANMNGLASNSTNAEYVSNESKYMRFHWSDQGGQPAWLWGGNDAGHMYIYNPSNFSVNYANSANNADKLDNYHAAEVYKAATHTINNYSSVNDWVRIATIHIGGTGLAMGGFTAILSNRECLDNSSFILTVAIRRNSTTSITCQSFYTPIGSAPPKQIIIRSNDGVNFYVYFKSVLNSWTTYYNVTKIMTENNVTFENAGVSSANLIAGSALNVTAARGGFVDRATDADTVDGYHASAFVKKAGDTMTGNLNSNSEFITTSYNGFRISAASSTNTKSILLRNDGSDFYILCCNSAAAGNNWYTPTGGNHPFRINLTTGYSYFSKVYGAVWNDYAEYRSTSKVKPGQCVIETGLGNLIQSTKRLQPGANIVSDTFGFAIGETEQTKTPIAVSGRVLAYPYEDRNSYQAGDPVCSGPNGTISKMTREEVREYPDRIIGTVSEIPDYEVWGTGNVKVNNRIWIKVK